MARVRQTEGDLDGALELLWEAERVYAGDFSPNVRPVAAIKARLWVAQGRLQEARGWAREHGLAADDDLTYLHEFEHITLARLLLAQGARDRDESGVRAAMGLLERLLVAAEGGGRHGSALEILVVQALAHHAAGDTTAALASLARAIDLAEPEGYVRVFIDEGPPMATLLKLAAKQPNASGYVRRLLAGMVTTEGPRPAGAATDRAAQRAGARGPAPPGERPGRPGHRARARGVPGHGADTHPEHLRQARREQPTGSRPPRRRARPALPLPGPPTHRVALVPGSHSRSRIHHPAHHLW